MMYKLFRTPISDLASLQCRKDEINFFYENDCMLNLKSRHLDFIEHYLNNDRHGLLQRRDARERAKELHPVRARLAGDIDAGEILSRRHHHIGIRLVIQQPGVVARLNILDRSFFVEVP